MSAALIPLALFLINETTKDIYVLPGEAAAQIEGARPCAPIKTNIASTTFSVSTLDQFCTSVAQGLIPRVNSVVKTTWSMEHAQSVGGVIRSLQFLPNLRADVPIWPPEIPFSLAGLTTAAGMSIVVGVKTPDKQPALIERLDVWSRLDERFTRAYWSRSMNDPTYASTQARIIARMGTYIQRAWKSQPVFKEKPEMMRILVDKKISERELAVIESMIKAYSKGAPESAISPIEVRREGIVYQTFAGKNRQADILNRLSRELPAFRAQALTEGPADVSVMLATPN